ncbi:protein SQS1-like [Salvia miltiorrhiza]|uniref:protein SQS1-like n=1 Tax=Salvia miltiorrhiza TaxID=226208 RepID=UPI0025AC3FE8|nr:protein SQS1-like [Salvia miltiorrhiza]
MDSDSNESEEDPDLSVERTEQQDDEEDPDLSVERTEQQDDEEDPEFERADQQDDEEVQELDLSFESGDQQDDEEEPEVDFKGYILPTKKELEQELRLSVEDLIPKLQKRTDEIASILNNSELYTFDNKSLRQDFVDQYVADTCFRKKTPQDQIDDVVADFMDKDVKASTYCGVMAFTGDGTFYIALLMKNIGTIIESVKDELSSRAFVKKLKRMRVKNTYS